MVESSAIQRAARVVGVAFVVIGILGFIPGITDDAPGGFAGADSDGSLFGIFQTSVLHNLVHLLLGVLGLVLSRTWEGSRNFLIGGGVVYLGLGAFGLVGAIDWLPADDSDDWLHLFLGGAMVAVGVLLRGRARGRVGAIATGG